MKEKATVVIIGLGGIGFRYDYNLSPDSFILTHARAFSVHPYFKIVGGVDLDVKNRSDFSETFQCTAYKEIKEALINEKPYIVVVATPTETHNKVIKNIFLYSKPSIILCEKPLAYNLEEAKEILAICKSNQTELYVNYMRNSSKTTVDIFEKIQNGEIKSPFKVVHWYSKGLFNSASHFITFFNYLFGEVLNVELLDKNLQVIQNIDPEPSFKINYECSEVLFIPLSYHNFFHNSFELIGKNGRLLYERGGEYVKWFPVDNNNIHSNYKSLSQNPVDLHSDFNTMQLELVDNLWKKMNGLESFICSGDEAFNTMLILNKIINYRN